MVETSHPGNIGAAARAMKTMCLQDLALVQPKIFPDSVAFARASGAADILESARRFEDLPTAIADCQKVIGITARGRKISAPVVTPNQLVRLMYDEMDGMQVAWVFGRERNGLSNEEIDLCDTICTIPSNDDYSSLNIAAAVQVLCYEWYTAQQLQGQKPQINPMRLQDAAPVSEKEGFYEHLWGTLNKIGFLDEDNPTPLMRKVRRLFDRVQLTSAEINILRGVLKCVSKQ